MTTGDQPAGFGGTGRMLQHSRRRTFGRRGMMVGRPAGKEKGFKFLVLLVFLVQVQSLVKVKWIPCILLVSLLSFVFSARSHRFL